MRPRSLSHTLLAAIAVVVVVSGGLISQLVVHRYGASLLEAAEAQAHQAAHKLAMDAAELVLINDLVALQRMLEGQMAANPAVSYIFIFRDGQVLSHTFPQGVPIELLAANAPDDADAGRTEKIVSQEGARFLDIAWPIFGGRAGVLRIGFSEETHRRKISALWVEMSLITALILAVALAAGHLFVFRLTRPLRRLADLVEKVDEEHLALPERIGGGSEIDRLGRAFERMLERLRDHTGRLKESNQHLARSNQELDRAQRRLHISLAISQEISALPSLDEVGLHLVRAFDGVIECPHKALLLFNSRRDEAFLVQDGRTTLEGADTAGKIHGLIGGLPGVDFLDRGLFDPLPLPASRRVAVLPFRHQGELLGAMLIACPAECACVSRELEVIDLILTQTAGTLRRAMRHEEEIRGLRARVEPSAEFSGLVGKDTKMQLVYKLIEDVAPTDATVLIQGESGTGKELVARAIHRLSGRRAQPLVVINCAAYPSTLLESELFGHEKGAFTGASRRRIGRFEQADGGTVFLDEIGEIPQTAQIKLLRVLQSQKFERLGGEQTLAVDVRVLAATNRNLIEQVKAGRFREDLFYRLNVIPIHLPPLRERQNDIPVLARHFLKSFAERQGKALEGFAPEAMRALLAYRWPGNVRELENTIEHAVVLAKGGLVEAVDLPAALSSVGAPPDGKAAADPSVRTISGNEARLLLEVLEECHWNKSLAAARLGISRSTLYEKIKKYRLIPPTVH